jgi:tetratricopeptide (TPR) repeat protein
MFALQGCGSFSRNRKSFVIATAWLAVLVSMPATPLQAEPAHCAGYEVADINAMQPMTRVIWLTEELAQCTDTSANRAVHLSNRASAWYELEEYGRADEDYRQAIGLNPAAAYAYAGLADVLQALNDSPGALAMIDRAIALEGPTAPLRLGRGRILADMGEYRLAITEYDESLQLDPNYGIANLYRGLAYQDLGDTGRALQEYETALQLDASNFLAQWQRGEVLAQLGRSTAARRDFETVLALMTDPAMFYNEAAWHLYLSGGEHAAALAFVRRALADEPGTVAYLDTEGHLLAALGEPGPALASFEHGLRLADAEFVARAQRGLASQGYFTGTADGVYGPATRAALEACIRDACNIWKQN